MFNELDDLKKTSNRYLKDTANKYGIVYSTLTNKYNIYCNDKDKCIMNSYNRGGSNKIFTDENKMTLYDYIKKNFIDNHKPLTNEIIKQIALKQF